jgi:hypothetical protein
VYGLELPADGLRDTWLPCDYEDAGRVTDKKVECDVPSHSSDSFTGDSVVIDVTTAGLQVSIPWSPAADPSSFHRGGQSGERRHALRGMAILGGARS